MLQDAKAGEQRHDTVGANHWNTRFIFPFQYIENNDFIQVYYQVSIDHKWKNLDFF